MSRRNSAFDARQLTGPKVDYTCPNNRDDRTAGSARFTHAWPRTSGGTSRQPGPHERALSAPPHDHHGPRRLPRLSANQARDHSRDLPLARDRLTAGVACLPHFAHPACPDRSDRFVRAESHSGGRTHRITVREVVGPGQAARGLRTGRPCHVASVIAKMGRLDARPVVGVEGQDDCFETRWVRRLSELRVRRRRRRGCQPPGPGRRSPTPRPEADARRWRRARDRGRCA